VKIEARSSFGWGATRAGRATPSQGIVIHYDGFNRALAAKGHAACRAYWKKTRAFHMGSTRGWVDIGYSWGVCPHGGVFEGRGLYRSQAAQPGGNSTWYSVTTMGGDSEDLTGAQIEALRDLRAWLRAEHGVGDGVRGHRDFISTSCPGDRTYKLIKSGALFGAGADWMENLMNKLPTLRRGDRGEDVQTLQALLQARSHPEVAMTGIFDQATWDAVQAVQRWGGVDDDGIVGPRTWPILVVRQRSKAA
jgi:hypothetical protein